MLLIPFISTDAAGMKTFQSKEELERFINMRMNATLIFDSPSISIFEASRNNLAAKSSNDYSTTNIQVEGVDEADIVKTDGERIFLASNNKIYIIKAFPAYEMKIISMLEIDGNIHGLFIKGNNLVIIYSKSILILDEILKKIIRPRHHVWLYMDVYDIADKPNRIGSIAIDGWYIASRMVENYVYMVSIQPIRKIELPRISIDGFEITIPPNSIYYSEAIDRPYGFTIITAVDISSPSLMAAKAVLTGSTTDIYMSKNNLYVAFPKFRFTTELYRISIKGLDISCKNGLEVPGMIINQFSMDEYDGYFRVATTSTNGNNIYVIRVDDMKIVGKLEGLAYGERIYSARFMGDRCYLVTFKIIDPLFTIDLSNPLEPRVLGELKIPGFSQYLHPYDNNHLIGIGRDVILSEYGDFAWHQGLKISLFDVSNVSYPKEVSSIIIGDRGTYSPVLFDHHAFLLIKEKNMFVIPILEIEKLSDAPPWEYGKPIFQGAYVFKISYEGIILIGKISHCDSNYYEVKRCVYIDNALYTISDAKVKANSLIDLSEIHELKIHELILTK
ncbi:MAG: beta-propeller domain-containing protein [Candidatus Methanomethyliaceae archaeon]|nr:beta-propeller domain-containing protein [Candidatus Methanomethyliaceae archaeon]MDW7970993.1 beta-propeller domain-containing protein [Nitrososphaerota archaeon]